MPALSPGDPRRESRFSRRWPGSTTTQIALLLFLAMVGTSAIIVGFIARVTQGQLDSDARALISAEREAIVVTFNREGPMAARDVIVAELLIPGPLAVRLEDAKGHGIAGNIAVWPQKLPRQVDFTQINLVRSGQATAEPFAVTSYALPNGYHLLVGRTLAEEERLTETLATSLLAATGLALLLATGISFVATRIIARRVQNIADVAGAVAAGDLTRRVDVRASGSRDAFDRLGTALNAMLARIEVLLDELRSVTDGLAHDLRSPLTRLKARIDRVQRDGDTAAADFAAIGAEADALLAMLDNSLEISRAEAGIGRDRFVEMDLASLARDMVDMYEPLAEDNGVRLTAICAVVVPIRAHRELLGRALSNLIDNALRYGAAGGTIEVAAETTVQGARLTVADRGPGIAAADRDDALRRFGRLDASRSARGAGLGLALAAAIARLHGGTLTLHANNPGLLVAIDLPERDQV
jgi:signal transduction histidine kinase